VKTQIEGKILNSSQLDLFDSNPSRLVILSSESHRQPKMNSINIAQLSCTKENYFSVLQYNRSKYCNVLHMHHLACKLAERNVIVHSVHPGNMVQTGIQRRWWGWKLLFALASPFTKTVTQGKTT
jgi:WW domain-containing oxidoreductase